MEKQEIEDRDREKEMEEKEKLEKTKNLGVPQVLINKWLNIETKKSKFIQKQNQIDNEADVSKYSESSMSISTNRFNDIAKKKRQRMSKFVAKKTSSNLELQSFLQKPDKLSIEPAPSPGASFLSHERIKGLEKEKSKIELSEEDDNDSYGSVSNGNQEFEDDNKSVKVLFTPPNSSKTFNFSKDVINRISKNNRDIINKRNLVKKNQISKIRKKQNDSQEHEKRLFSEHTKFRLRLFSPGAKISSPTDPKSKTLISKLCTQSKILNSQFRGYTQQKKTRNKANCFWSCNSIRQESSVASASKTLRNSRRNKRTQNRSVVPTLVNLKEVTEIQGKTFAKFNLKFNEPNLVTLKPNLLAKTLVSQFKCTDIKPKKLKSPKNVNSITTGFKAELPLLRPTTTSFRKCLPIRSRKMKVKISLESAKKTRKNTSKRLWSPVHMTTCEWVKPIP
ncbi:unnamed protein product [Moneuplotes crassus]|uniref:Uncharacterized protein n=1 Tax=Euplotes crassus TaxID=5936 RepID=A0AAD2D773_EUPCR|nr:unnamed protein product [Moneuplotes crassus]